MLIRKMLINPDQTIFLFRISVDNMMSEFKDLSSSVNTLDKQLAQAPDDVKAQFQVFAQVKKATGFELNGLNVFDVHNTSFGRRSQT